MHRIKRDYSIEITSETGCFNNPHYFSLKVKEPKEVIKAILLKGYEQYSNNWEISIYDNKIELRLGIKKIEKVDEIINSALLILDKLLDITTFEINIAKELLEKI